MTWRTSFPARQVNFSVEPPGRTTDSGGFGFASGRGRTRFTLRLHPQRPRALRRLVLEATDREAEHARSVPIRVTG